MFTHRWPYQDMHELNLDWLLGVVNEMKEKVDNLNVDEIIKELIDDGTIYDHFGAYFSRYYVNYNDMVSDPEIQNGMFVYCFGAVNAFDGGECYFHIIDTTGDCLPTVNGLYAYPAHSDYMSVIPYYAITNELGAAINMMQTKGIKNIYVPSSIASDTITTQVDLYNDLEVSKDVEITLDAPIVMHGATLRGGSYRVGNNFPALVESMIQLNENTNTVDEANILVNVSGKIGIGCFDGKGIITECTIDGQDTGKFGIWGETAPADYTLDVRDCYITRFWLNGLFTEAKSCLVQGCTFEYNHRQTTPNGGGQLCLKGGNTQGYNEIMNCQIKNPGGNVTSGIELWLSGNAIIHGNYIHNAGSDLDCIAVQSGCFADIYDNTLHGSTALGTGIHLYGNYAKINTHDNWYASINGDNIRITDPTQSGAIKEKRFTAPLIKYTSAVKPLFDVEGAPVIQEHVVAAGELKVRMYEDDIFTLIDITNAEMVTVFGTVSGNFLINGTMTNLVLSTDGTDIKIKATNDCDVYIYRS